MALNYSHRSIFSATLAEDKLVSPMRIVNGYLVEGIPENNLEGFARPRYVNREIEECFNFGRDRADRCGSSESASKDIVDLLPSDPFGMDISTTVTAITGWLEDLEVDYGGYGRSNVGGSSKEEYDLFAGFNLIWNNAMRFQSFPGHFQADEKFRVDTEWDWHDGERYYGNASAQHKYQPTCNQGDIAGFDHGSTSATPLQIQEQLNGSLCCFDDKEAPHEAMFFALSYLGVKDLLSVERVCRSLHSTVRSDPLLWRSIHIDQPLNERISDDILLQLTSRAQGNLQCLSLVECQRVTDDGVRRVLDANPRLTKLCVPGCTRLSIDCIVNIVKAFNSGKGTLGIKHLRIGGLYGITDQHFEELMVLLGANSSMQQGGHKPHFYHRGNFYLPCDDDRVIDIETCPRCQKLRLVYDCPAEGCQTQDHTAQVCRACTLCIARCIQCGKCINDNEYEETFCLEILCSECFKPLINYQDKVDSRICPS